MRNHGVVDYTNGRDIDEQEDVGVVDYTSGRLRDELEGDALFYEFKGDDHLRMMWRWVNNRDDDHARFLYAIEHGVDAALNTVGKNANPVPPQYVYAARNVEHVTRNWNLISRFESWATANGYRNGCDMWVDITNPAKGWRPGNVSLVQDGKETREIVLDYIRSQDLQITAFGETKWGIEWLHDDRCKIKSHSGLLARIRRGIDPEKAIRVEPDSQRRKRYELSKLEKKIRANTASEAEISQYRRLAKWGVATQEQIAIIPPLPTPVFTPPEQWEQKRKEILAAMEERRQRSDAWWIEYHKLRESEEKARRQARADQEAAEQKARAERERKERESNGIAESADQKPASLPIYFQEGFGAKKKNPQSNV